MDGTQIQTQMWTGVKRGGANIATTASANERRLVTLSRVDLRGMTLIS